MFTEPAFAHWSYKFSKPLQWHFPRHKFYVNIPYHEGPCVIHTANTDWAQWKTMLTLSTNPVPPPPHPKKRLWAVPTYYSHYTSTLSTFLISFGSTPPYSYICHVVNPQKKFSQTLTLDFPSASIKSSTYVTSPTTNQIPDDTYTKGEKPRKQWEFRTINNLVWSLCLIRKPRNTPYSLNHRTGELQMCSKVKYFMSLIFLHCKTIYFHNISFLSL